MEEKTGVYALVGLAAIGVIAYFLIKSTPQPPPPPGQISADIKEFSLAVV